MVFAEAEERAVLFLFAGAFFKEALFAGVRLEEALLFLTVCVFFCVAAFCVFALALWRGCEEAALALPSNKGRPDNSSVRAVATTSKE